MRRGSESRAVFGPWKRTWQVVPALLLLGLFSTTVAGCESHVDDIDDDILRALTVEAMNGDWNAVVRITDQDQISFYADIGNLRSALRGVDGDCKEPNNSPGTISCDAGFVHKRAPIGYDAFYTVRRVSRDEGNSIEIAVILWPLSHY